MVTLATRQIRTVDLVVEAPEALVLPAVEEDTPAEELQDIGQLIQTMAAEEARTMWESIKPLRWPLL